MSIGNKVMKSIRCDVCKAQNGPMVGTQRKKGFSEGTLNVKSPEYGNYILKNYSRLRKG